MIPSGVEIFMATTPIDLRWSYDRLSGVVREHLGTDVRSGALFVFFGKRRQGLKILFYDGTGLCVLAKRLDRGVFYPPVIREGNEHSVELSDAELITLFSGLDLTPATLKYPSIH